MNKSEYIQAKTFIYSDIQREINLAYASQNSIKRLLLKILIDNTGGANFMAALALLAYTEFAGKIKFKNKKTNGDDHASKNFNDFFDELGTDYSNFRKSHNVYDIFRCGLAHEYYIKKTCTIHMIKQKGKSGIGIDKTGKYIFIVEQYFEDFKKAFDNLEKL